MTLEDHGSNRPQDRELTANERYILCRIITDRIHDDERLLNSTLPNFLKERDATTALIDSLVEIRTVINPREED